MAASNNQSSSVGQRLFANPIRAFGVMSVVLLLSLAIAPAKNHFSEWRHYQKQYLRLIQGRGDALTLHRHFEGGIQQIWLPELGVVDRCSSSPVAQNEARLSDESLPPSRPDPAIPHKVK